MTLALQNRPLTAGLLGVIAALLLGACGPQNPPRTPRAIAPEDGARPTATPLLNPQLTWTSEITRKTLGEWPDGQLLSTCLHDVVSSRTAVRPDERHCSECHYRGSEAPYRPDIDQYSNEAMPPFVLVDGKTWAGEGGWAERFVSLTEHGGVDDPSYLFTPFAKWRADGEREREGITWRVKLSLSALGYAPNDNIANGRLVDVINNRISARPDGKLCSECHYPGSAAAYRPDNARDEAHDIEPETLIDGNTWAAPGGWAERFLVHGEGAETEKPAYLRELFALWLEDGGR